MPRKILAICLATLAFSLWGYIWYATIFDDIWQGLINRSEADLIALAVARGSLQNVLTLLISLIQVLGIYTVLYWSKASTFLQHIGTALILAVLIVLPALGNATLFAGTPFMLLLVDFAHFSLGYAGIAFVFYLILPKPASASVKER